MFGQINLNASPDVVKWSLGKSEIFSTKSIYQFLERNISGPHNKWIWKANIPLKIKVFMWQVFQDAILTRENMRKRNWLGAPLCSFCGAVETSNHLFFQCSIAKITWGSLGKVLGTTRCPKNLWQSFVWFHYFLPGGDRFYMVGMAAVCWAIWILRNKLTFEHYVLRNPVEIVFTVCSFLLHWTGLQKEEDRIILKTNTKFLMAVAAGLVADAGA
jgi:hypothetical protein